ncbi:MAG: (S)-ureidoglycine aminohydrolase [Terrimicrobiaceae bacterium]|nr:(S)-ureidoglycine aminohydrolase [Terrimicrobiaceae bacterium]
MKSAMTGVFGETRTRVEARHALIADDGHVPSVLPGFESATPYILIAPPLSRSFSQILIRFADGGRAGFRADGIETAFYVQSGTVRVSAGAADSELGAGGFGFCPAGSSLSFVSDDAVVTCFRKTFVPQGEAPVPLFGNAADVPAVPFLGNPKALLRTLLPDHLGFDLGMNVFTYAPGATLPFVETHIMEHGLLMLAGQGVYRLEDRYYPVRAGDVIWMAPWCPQWFVAMGDEPASYLYYKDVNRSADPE